MTRPARRGAIALVLAALPPSAGPAVWFSLPEPWGALAGFYLFLVFGALAGAARARPGYAAPCAFRFGVAFAIPGAVLPWSLVPPGGADLLASTAAAWGLSLGAGAALGALLAGSRLSGAEASRIVAAGRWGTAFFAGGATGGAAASLLVGVLPARGYPVAWAIGLVGAGGLAARLLRPSAS